MRCIISTPVKTETYDNLISVSIPTKDGLVQIKTGHAEFFAEVVAGEIICVTKTNKTTKLEVAKGICRVIADDITVII